MENKRSSERPSLLGSYIRGQRQLADLSLRQLAEQAGVSNPYLSQIERGLRKPSAEVLQQSDLAIRFHGFVEGTDIGAGTVDVIVTDGFTGNIALKTAEGTARFVADLLRRAFSSSARSKAAMRRARISNAWSSVFRPGANSAKWSLPK